MSKAAIRDLVSSSITWKARVIDVDAPSITLSVREIYPPVLIEPAELRHRHIFLR